MRTLLIVAVVGGAAVYLARKLVVVPPEKFVLEHLKDLYPKKDARVVAMDDLRHRLTASKSREVGRDTAA